MQLRYLLALAVLIWTGTPAEAHRVGESYIYVDVTDDEMTGRFHIRLADLTKAVDLDANGDGRADDAEFEAKSDQVNDYLADRLSFFTGGERHKVRFSGHGFFGPEDARQVDIRFEIPTLGPPPEALEVEYRFLYDRVDPAHRPMLLQASNTRLRLKDNEAMVSLVFEPGAERQVLSLVPPPFAELFGRFVLRGVYQILKEPVRILFAIILFLPAVMLRTGTGWTPGETTRGAIADAVQSLTLFAVGFTAALALPVFQVLTPAKEVAQALFVLSFVLLAVDNFRPFRYLSRAQVALLLGVLHGLGPNVFIKKLGLNEGFAEIALPGFGVGILLAMALIAGVVVPLVALVCREPLYHRFALRYSCLPLMLAAGLWFV